MVPRSQLVLSIVMLIVSAVVLCFAWEPQLTKTDAAFVISIVMVVPILYWFLFAVSCSVRLMELKCCKKNPSILRDYVNGVRYGREGRAEHALQILADYWGHPAGHVECWPLMFHTKDQINRMLEYYSKQIEQNEADALEQAARQAMAQEKDLPTMPLPPVIFGDRGLRNKDLPPLLPYRFIRHMRGRVDDILRRTALAINKSSTIENTCSAEVGELFASLYREALQSGMQLRVESLRSDNPGYVLRDVSSDLSSMARRHLNEVLYRFARLYYETDPRNIFPDNLDRVRRLLTDFWGHGVEVGVRLGETQNPPQPKEKPIERPADLEQLFETKVEKLTEPPVSAVEREASRPPVRPLSEAIAEYSSDLAEKVKNVLLDLEVPDDERPVVPTSPLPPLEKQQFLTQVRAEVEPILDQFVDAINSEETAPQLERTQLDAYHLFGRVGERVVDLALAARLELAAKAVSSGDSRPRRVRCKRVSEIRLPHRPGTQGGWVEKYRRMRAWHAQAQ
jgi:hypothetical protein